MNAAAYVRDLELNEGQSVRVNCPVCNGNKTFTASKNNGVVLYNCYKADCKIRGMSTVGMSASDVKAFMQQRTAILATEDKRAAPMELPITLSYSLEHKDVAKFITKWGLQNTDLMHDIVQHRVVFPIRDTKGTLIDAAGRTLRGDVPKWLRYTGRADFYHQGSGPIAVVVEDCISAAVVSKMDTRVTGVAILGTSLNQTHIKYLSNFNAVILALDPDAASKTVAYTLQLRSHDIDSYGMMLSDDLKYRTSTDTNKLKEIIDDCIN